VNSSLISQILTVLSTMKGYPSMPPLNLDDAGMDPVRAGYAGLLMRMPDALGIKVRGGVLLRFDERPSVKNLADWAQSIGSVKTFNIEDLSARQLTGPVGEDAPTGPPPAVRAVFAELQKQILEESRGKGAGSAVYGLQFKILPGFAGAGQISRTYASFSRAAAEKSAEDRNRCWSHQQTTVFHRSDPSPQRGREHMHGVLELVMPQVMEIVAVKREEAAKERRRKKSISKSPA